MKIYFLSSIPCALTLSGVFYGVTDSFERSVELSLSDNVYARFSPEGYAPLGFFITEEIVRTPPSGCQVYLLKDGVAVYAYDFTSLDTTLRPLLQKREGELLATVFSQGKTQLCLESPQGTFTATLPPSFTPTSICFHRNAVLLANETALAVYSHTCTPLLFEKILEYQPTEEGFTATLPLSDRLQRTAACEWRLEENKCLQTAFSLRQARLNDENPDEPPADLVAYAFLESVLLRGDYAAFLSDELQEEQRRILDFLGEFTAVVLTENTNECGLVRKRKTDLFFVDYIQVEVISGKIVDLRG